MISIEFIGVLKSIHTFCCDSAVMDDAALLAPHIGAALYAAALITERAAPLKRDMVVLNCQQLSYFNRISIALTSELGILSVQSQQSHSNTSVSFPATK
jgi:hypothetical protein